MACKKSKIDHKRLAADLQLLASRFEGTANALVAGAHSRTAIGDARDHMTEAGRILLKLVIGGLLAHPPVAPSWLKLSIRSGDQRPRFVGSVVQTDIGIINEIDSQGMTLSAVLRRELSKNGAVRQHKTHRASDLRLGNLRRRLVFLEAATGWLADQFQIKPRIHPPKRRLLVRTDNGNSPVDLCFDLIDEEDPQTCQFFVSVCRNGRRVCSLLASKLENAEGESAEDKQTEPSDLADVLARYNDSCEEMHTMRLNPRKAIPVDQWPEETQRRGSAIVRAHDWARYKRYVLQVATQNERRASLAKVWWSWWEASQIEPSKAGLEPLVPPGIRAALRTAAAGRRAEFSNHVQGTTRVEKIPANDPAGMNGRQSSKMMEGSADAQATGSIKAQKTPAVLSCHGDYWDIGFGDSTSRMRHQVGLAYIQKLIANANSPTHSWTLRYDKPTPNTPAEPLADKSALEAMRKTVDSLEEQKRETVDLDKRTDIEAELESARRYLRAATQVRGAGREQRQVRTEIDRTRETVGKAIKRALKAIKPHCEPLFTHISGCIAKPTAMSPCYQCPNSELPAWDLRKPD